MLNQPYGLFFAIDLPGKAFDTYPNAHNFYGDFRDLDAAKIEDVKKFYEQYYAPNNAVLAIVGDVKPDEVFAKVEKYSPRFLARVHACETEGREPPQTAERDRRNRQAGEGPGTRHRISHAAARIRPMRLVGAVAGELLHNGQASRLYQSLVKEKQVALSVDGGVNWPLGAPFEYNGPTLMTSFIVYPASVTEEQLLAAFDANIRDLIDKGPSQQDLDRVVTKMRSDWYGNLENPIDRASALSHATLFDGSFDLVYQIPRISRR